MYIRKAYRPYACHVPAQRHLLLPIVLVLASVSGCGAQAPYATTVGVLHPRQRIIVRIASGTVNAYAPVLGQPRDQFTVEAFAANSPAPAAPRIRPVQDGTEIDAPAVSSLLVRVPHDVNLTVVSRGGDVNVTDISGSVNVTATSGAVTLMLPDYGSARILEHGDISAIIGASSWPGMLSFTTPRGNVYVSVNENARFTARLSTRDGIIYTDFNLRGTSHGLAERIVAAVHGGAAYGIIAHTDKGAIRLLKLAPQY